MNTFCGVGLLVVKISPCLDEILPKDEGGSAMDVIQYCTMSIGRAGKKAAGLA